MRMPVEQISIIGRNTQGVRLMQLGEENSIACVALLPHQEITDDEDILSDTPETDAVSNAPDVSEATEASEPSPDSSNQ